jgi:mannose-6-phosphate isomerase-like protein (cupin superfamily)
MTRAAFPGRAAKAMTNAATEGPIARGRFSAPVSAAAVRRDWRARGFTCETFADPPGREWNGFVHDTDELVTVIEGRLRVLMNGNTHEIEAGDELFIPKGILHSVHNLHRGVTRWLFGYGRAAA